MYRDNENLKREVYLVYKNAPTCLRAYAINPDSDKERDRTCIQKFFMSFVPISYPNVSLESRMPRNTRELQR